ncbi:glycosyltransferase family 2 protein [Geitlerinema sp. P-1104]|nr:glycosyltransferase family A protein [Geitlerinema sp. P-1104]NMG59563.1 glycosyltransferase family 2 protein [Geitlerinema sp. P-1104]
MIKVSIVIRCCNEEKHIGRLLSGIQNQTASDWEIIVVDSGSTDSTLSIVQNYPAKIVRIKPEDFSFGYALNVGCREAKGDYIVLASAHVYPVYRDWIDRLIAPFENPNVALTYGKQRGEKITKYSEHQVFKKWFPDKSNLDQAHPFCNNANAAIRRSLWEKFPYNERLTGLEDLDWARKLKNMSFQVAYVSSAEVIHVHEECPRQVYNRYRREAIAFRSIFPEERFTWIDFIRLFFGNSISDLYHAWHDGHLLKNWLEIIIFRFMQFWGAYRGFIQSGPISSTLKQTFYYPNGLYRNKNNVKSEQNNLERIEYSSSHEQ